MDKDLLELEAIADDKSQEVPSNLGVETLIDRMEKAEEVLSFIGDAPSSLPHTGRKLILRVSGLAASFALVASIGLAWHERPPKDTFDDPALAYAELEDTFAMIGKSLAMGSAAMDEAESKMSRPIKAFERMFNPSVEE